MFIYSTWFFLLITLRKERVYSETFHSMKNLMNKMKKHLNAELRNALEFDFI